MKQAPDPDVEVSEGAELDAGWDEPQVPSAAPVAASARVAAPVAVTLAAPADEIDQGWDDDEDDAEDEAVAAVSAPLRAKPVAVVARRAEPQQSVEGGTRRALSKKERRELERQNRAHAARKGVEQKATRRVSRREEARRVAAERQEERTRALEEAKKKARQAKKAAEKARARRVVETDDEDAESSAPLPTRGTRRQAEKAARNQGRLKKPAGGGLIIAIIALITLATGLYAWSKR